ncbi:uncharacterized protein LOC115732409 [Rhodamnia argentea]|uniref:Uncharacterized protein LOC115732409 n=1 Tax=Rhodamnia argentea TaxID=178133 RepID=A0A8B8N921_9MYRT|nr:uncharacterized protein LOC115732409 [Rhodamnia argentea]XP_030518913.1 uncharacterized protein LOC115732409 [Rhodamnia argentea]XP_048127852.1 uncharacterized protein LOC115732409 [Rhodamnia argentea]
MEGGNTTLYLRLHKLSVAAASEEAIDAVLTTLWRTRRTGLAPPDKSHIQSLLGLPSASQVDPVSACLRSLIRKCVNDDFVESDLSKLFPPDLPVSLQGLLVSVLLKHKNQWREDILREQHSIPRSSISYQVKTSMPPTFTTFPSSETSAFSQPHQADPCFDFNCRGGGGNATITADSNVSQPAPMSLQHDVGAPENMATVPRFVEMNWTIEKQKASANKVAAVALKLQDHSKSPFREKEVKFQLTRETLEAMLRSMAYIKEQLSSMAGSSAEPLQKKQKQ